MPRSCWRGSAASLRPAVTERPRFDGAEALLGERRRAEPTPLFVLGTARSGTTWLANLLVSHPSITGLTAVEHHGIHESHLLDHTRYVLPGTMTCDAFVSRYAAEDYFALSRISPAELCAAAPPTGDAVTFFAALMGLVARREGARYWLEKTPKHAIYFETLLERFPTARFVIIERGFEATIASQLAKYARPGSGPLRRRLEKVFRYESDMRALRAVEVRAAGRAVRVSRAARRSRAASWTSSGCRGWS
jgi:hypothetical protein